MGKHVYDNRTIVALATATGQSAIAVIRLSGPEALRITDSIFSKKISEKPSHTIHFGHISIGGRQIDECLISIFLNPHSYTKEDVVEISCHGSPYIIDTIIKSCLDKGAHMAQKGEFTQRAFLNGQLDLSQAEAVADLIASDSKSSHQLAIKQLRGGVSNDLKKLRENLIDLASLLELELDFGEEDVEFASRATMRNTVSVLSSHVRQLIDTFHNGNAIKHGIKTVLAGKPNAGKSTLLNAMLNTERAIVSSIPGTTRDTIDDTLIINGVKFLLTDTAGLRESQDEIEAQGVERSLQHIEASQVILYVIDVSKESPETIWKALMEMNIDKEKIILVLNKMDLYPTADPDGYIREGLLSKAQIIPISAINKMNIVRIKEKLVSMSYLDKIEDVTVITNARHYEALCKTETSLNKVIEGIDSKISGDIMAMDLRHALFHLGEITGEIHTDDLLNNIFSNFCIGK